MSNGAFDELGAKVQRAQSAVREIRGVGRVGGIAVEVDAENRLVALHHPDADIDSSLHELNIAPGHAYEMTAHDDPVAHMNCFGWSPGYMSEFTHLDTDATTTADGVDRQGATGHSDYPRSGDNNKLRTSGYNTAVVIAGLGDVPGLLVVGDSAMKTGGIDILDGLVDLTR